jgi:hypothetical protein
MSALTDRRRFLTFALALAGAPAALAAPSGELTASATPPPGPKPSARRLVEAARRQIGVTTQYDPTYRRLLFPGGDPPRDRGVCTDVVIRAYRDAFGLDLQALVNADMRRAFSAYPKKWGLAGPDPNIDHRRVPNLEAFFRRRGMELARPADPADCREGDLVTMILPGSLPHIVIVTEERARSGRPLVVHNVGAGARQEDALSNWPITGRFRYGPTA